MSILDIIDLFSNQVRFKLYYCVIPILDSEPNSIFLFYFWLCIVVSSRCRRNVMFLP